MPGTCRLRCSLLLITCLLQDGVASEISSLYSFACHHVTVIIHVTYKGTLEFLFTVIVKCLFHFFVNIIDIYIK